MPSCYYYKAVFGMFSGSHSFPATFFAYTSQTHDVMPTFIKKLNYTSSTLIYVKQLNYQKQKH